MWFQDTCIRQLFTAPLYYPITTLESLFHHVIIGDVPISVHFFFGLRSILHLRVLSKDLMHATNDKELEKDIV